MFDIAAANPEAPEPCPCSFYELDPHRACNRQEWTTLRHWLGGALEHRIKTLKKEKTDAAKKRRQDKAAKADLDDPNELNAARGIEPSRETARNAFHLLMHSADMAGILKWAHKGVFIRVATMCSGTDSPIMSLKAMQEAFAAKDNWASVERNPADRRPSKFIGFEHVFSCEIEPHKQCFIHRNCPPVYALFNDVVDLGCCGLTGRVFA
jgi:hypothetical protein